MKNRSLRAGWISLVLLAFGAPALAAPPAPPADLVAKDAPNDVGNAVRLSWTLSPDDTPDVRPPRVMTYVIERKAEDETEFRVIETPTYATTSYVDRNCERGKSYLYRIAAASPPPTIERSAWVATDAPAVPTMQFFNTSKAWFGLILLLVGGSVTYFISVARSGRDLKIRKIAGLEAVTEAVGRATEMGRPVIFIPGIQDINDIQTVAAITILGNVARSCAEYDAKIEVPTARSLVMTTARETVQSAFLGAGRPDAYNEDLIYYITDEQFGYVAGVTGTMVRKKPAACFYMGAFYAESLILAETGNSIGAIQVAGTAMPSQLPFFVAACDYTLIGEEFFAASAYLSGEPHQLGSLKGQDVGKLLAGVLITVGCLAATVAAVSGGTGAGLASFLKNNVLGSGGFLP